MKVFCFFFFSVNKKDLIAKFGTTHLKDIRQKCVNQMGKRNMHTFLKLGAETPSTLH